MAALYYDRDADLSRLQNRRIAVIGYGSQGHAHALGLLDSGLDVRVGLQRTSRNWERAQAAGLRVCTVREASAEADVIMLLVPDTTQPAVYQRDIAPELTAGKTLMFAHGFNIRYDQIQPSADIDVSMVAPKAPGHRVREVFVGGGGVPALIAVHQDASGYAFADALAYAKGIGCTRAGVLNTTFAEETETDLFGEQAVLCGGVSELVQCGFETLVRAGYQPEVAYFECLHELKLIVDLFYQGGLSYMRYSISDTAEYGDYTAGKRVINEKSRAAMQQILEQVRDGSFARRWIEENQQGLPNFSRMRRQAAAHPIERVGRELRRMMPFISPREVAEPTGTSVEAPAAAAPDGAETAQPESAGLRATLGHTALV